MPRDGGRTGEDGRTVDDREARHEIIDTFTAETGDALTLSRWTNDEWITYQLKIVGTVADEPEGEASALMGRREWTALRAWCDRAIAETTDE